MAQEIKNIDENCKDSWHNLVLKANISVRATNVLHFSFRSLREFMDYNPENYYKLRQCGKKTKQEIDIFRKRIQMAASEQASPMDTILSLDDGLFKPADPEALLKQPPNIHTLNLLPLYNYNKPLTITLEDLHPDFKAHTPLTEFDLSIRTSNVLQNLKLTVIGELMVYPANDLMDQKNFGRKCLNEVHKVVSDFVLYGHRMLPPAKTEQAPKPFPTLDFSSYAALIHSFLQHSLKKPRDRELVSWRFDFEGNLPTLEQIGVQFNITRERVRQILLKQDRFIRVQVRRGVLRQFWDTVRICIGDGGGMISPSELAQKLREEYRWPISPNPLALYQFLLLGKSENAFTIDKDVITAPCACHACDLPRHKLLEDDFQSHYWRVVADTLRKHCQFNCQHTPVKQFHRAFIENLINDSDSGLTIQDDIIMSHAYWVKHHNKRLGPLIVQVLKDNGQPMHFTDVAAAVREINQRTYPKNHFKGRFCWVEPASLPVFAVKTPRAGCPRTQRLDFWDRFKISGRIRPQCSCHDDTY